jgi:hypothetical protein
MAWTVLYHDHFVAEIGLLPEGVQDGLFTVVQLLSMAGPALGRPHADTLAGSAFANMKELRFTADNGVWRVAFAFDPKRRAIALVAGDKRSGVFTRR